MNPRSRALPWIALGIVYVVWGSTYLGIRVAVATIPPYLMTGTRYLIAGSSLFALQWIFSKRRPPMPSREEFLRISVVAVLLIVLGNGLLCVAETRVESGTAALLLASTPIWMVLFDSGRMRRAPSALAIAGVILGTIGLVALVGRGAGHADVLYAGIIMIASISWALGSVYARGLEHRPTTASFEMAVGGAIALVVGLLAGEGRQLAIQTITAASLWGMLWLITGGSMLGYSAYAFVVRTLPTATVATTGYVNPMIAVILGALLLHEALTWNVLAGGAAIVASVVLILLGSRTERDVPSTPEEI